MTDRAITVTGTAETTTEPEIATVRVRAAGSGETLHGARETARDHANTVRDRLADRVGDDERIRRLETKCRDSSDVFCDCHPEAPYTATVALAVDCVPDTVAGVVTAAVDAGGAVFEVEAGVTEQTRNAMSRRARAAAVEEARERAAAMAGAEGLAVGDVISIEETAAGGDDGIFDDTLPDAMATFAPDPISVSAEAEVTYELTASPEE